MKTKTKNLWIVGVSILVCISSVWAAEKPNVRYKKTPPNKGKAG